jgi:hypothetical protein
MKMPKKNKNELTMKKRVALGVLSVVLAVAAYVSVKHLDVGSKYKEGECVCSSSIPVCFKVVEKSGKVLKIVISTPFGSQLIEDTEDNIAQAVPDQVKIDCRTGAPLDAKTTD